MVSNRSSQRQAPASREGKRTLVADVRDDVNDDFFSPVNEDFDMGNDIGPDTLSK